MPRKLRQETGRQGFLLFGHENRFLRPAGDRAPLGIFKEVSVQSMVRRIEKQTESERRCTPMFTLDLNNLTPEQRAMVALWEEHMKAEFQDKDARASCDTMVANPFVNHVPVLTGGIGRRQLQN